MKRNGKTLESNRKETGKKSAVKIMMLELNSFLHNYSRSLKSVSGTKKLAEGK